MTEFVLPRVPLRAVTFDLDGLMFNTEEMYQEVDREILVRRGKPSSTELLDQMMGRKAQAALQLMIDWHQLTDTVEELLAESREIMLRLLPARLAPMPGLLNLLYTLEAAGIPRGIATSSSRKSPPASCSNSKWSRDSRLSSPAKRSSTASPLLTSTSWPPISMACGRRK